jgi:long-subunit fatty acid transport protein
LSGQGTLAPIGTIISEQSRTAFSIQGAGARALGLGGAFIALADDATAVTFNPAGLAQMVRPEMSFVGQGRSRGVAFQDVQSTRGARTFTVDDSLISNNRFDPLLASGTVPLQVGGRTLALQLSVQRVIPLGEGDARDMTERPLDGSAPTQLHQEINQDGQIDLYSFAAAYEVSQRILIGCSVNLWRGAWDLASNSTNMTAGNTSFVSFSQGNRLEGTNYNLGLLWRWPTWSLGITRRTAFHGDFTYNANLESSKTAKVVSAPYTTGLHWPSTTGIGLAYRPADHWVLAADLLTTAWSQARYMSNREALNGLNFFDMTKGNRTPDATQFHAGVERVLVLASGKVIPLRLGYSREPQPVTDRSTGQQRVIQGISLGSGVKMGAYTVDIGYRYGWGRRMASQYLDPEQVLSANQITTLGRESLIEHRLDVSFIYRFERGPVQDLLHYLFVGE